jgi:hypothetical protein
MASGLDDRVPAVFLQQGLGHLSRLVVPPQTLIDEFIALILVGLHKNRFEDVHPLVDGNGRRVFGGFLVRRNRRHAHEDVPDQVLEVREDAALVQVNGVSEVVVRFDKSVLVIHSEGTPEKALFSSYTKSIGYGKHRGEPVEGGGFPDQSGKRDVDRWSNKW